MVEAVDAPKENPDEDDELNVEPNGDVLGGQLDANKVELVPLFELKELAAEEEAEVLSPKVVAELKIPVEELEENKELPEEKAVFVAELEEGNDVPEEKAVLPLSPKDGDDADEPNGTDWV